MDGVTFGRVRGHRPRVLIVAGGPSARPLAHIHLAPRVHVVAVNGAADWLPRFDAWITVDPSAENRLRMRNAATSRSRYYACVPDDYGQPDARCPDHRAPAEPGVVYLHRLTGYGPWGARAGLSADPGALHTGNSAYAALGLAYLLGARRVVLAGVDATTAQRVDGGYPRDLAHLPRLFHSAQRELRRRCCNVRNACETSAVECDARMPLADALAWLVA